MNLLLVDRIVAESQRQQRTKNLIFPNQNLILPIENKRKRKKSIQPRSKSQAHHAALKLFENAYPKESGRNRICALLMGTAGAGKSEVVRHIRNVVEPRAAEQLGDCADDEGTQTVFVVAPTGVAADNSEGPTCTHEISMFLIIKIMLLRKVLGFF